MYKIELEGKKPRTQRDYKRILDKYFLPPFEKKDLASLTYEGIVKITNPLPKSEKAHALAVMRTFLRWCVRPPRRYIKHSPLEGVEITLAKSRKRVLTDSEIPIVWRAGRRSRWRARATGIRSRNRALSRSSIVGIFLSAGMPATVSDSSRAQFRGEQIAVCDYPRARKKYRL